MLLYTICESAYQSHANTVRKLNGKYFITVLTRSAVVHNTSTVCTVPILHTFSHTSYSITRRERAKIPLSGNGTMNITLHIMPIGATGHI